MQQNKIDLGRRIKYFRKRADMSQLVLETSAGLAAGVISRIESNQVNPNKETVLAISKVLDLNNTEIDFMIGATAVPATEKEMQEARQEAAEVMSKRGNLGYLLDDRWRFVMISDTFKKVLKMTSEQENYVIGRTTAQVIVEPHSPVMAWVDEKFREELIQTYLPQFYSDKSYLEDDPIYQRTIRAIMQNPMSKKTWDDLIKQKNRKFTSQEEMVIHFDMLGFKIPLYYAGHPMANHTRFEVVEFHTKNKFLDLLPKFI